MRFQSLDAKAQKALECPCIDDLRKGPCGLQFSEAFVCYLKSTVEEKVISNFFAKKKKKEGNFQLLPNVIYGLLGFFFFFSAFLSRSLLCK